MSKPNDPFATCSYRPINTNEPIVHLSIDPEGNRAVSIGLSYREFFAAMAMQGLLPGPNLHITNYISEDAPKEYAVVAVAMADALIAELNKGVK